MELFGIKNGKVYLANGAIPTKRDLQKITKACAVTVMELKGETIQVKKPDELVTKRTIDERRKGFLSKLEAWSASNPGKYPTELYKAFYKYWTATDDLSPTPIMRVELLWQKAKAAGKPFVFNFGLRLATFWKNCDQKTKSDYWSLDKK